MRVEEIKKKLEKSKNTKLEDFDSNSIPEITEIKINTKESIEERKKNFLISYSSPYFFKIKGKIVKIEYSDDNVSAEDCFQKAFEDMIFNNQVCE